MNAEVSIIKRTRLGVRMFKHEIVAVFPYDDDVSAAEAIARAKEAYAWAENAVRDPNVAYRYVAKMPPSSPPDLTKVTSIVIL